MRCPECGTASGSRARFCPTCGARLGPPRDRPDPPPLPRADAEPSGGGARRIAASVVAVVAAVVLAATILPGDDVPRLGSDDDVVTAAVVDEPWTVAAIPPIGAHVHTPVLGHGRIYVTSGTALYALGHTDGAVRWRYAHHGRVAGAPIVSGGMLVLAGRDGVTALEPDRGTERWHTRVDFRISPSGLATVGSGRDWAVVAAGHSSGPDGPVGRLAAYDVRTGVERWRLELEGFILGPPLAVDTTVFVATQRGTLARSALVAVDATDGTRLWHTDLGLPPLAMVESGGTVAVAGRDRVAALDAADGSLLWDVSVDPVRPRGFLGGLVALDVVVVATSIGGSDPSGEPIRGGSAHGLDLDTGERLWRVETPRMAGPPVRLDGTRVAIVTTEGLSAITADGEAEEWIVPLDRGPTARPVLLSRMDIPGTLLVGTEGGELVAVDTTAATVRWRTRLTRGLDDLRLVRAAGDLLLVAGRGVRAFDASSGRPVWETDENAGDASFDLAPDARPFTIAGGRVVERDPRSGEVVAEALSPDRDPLSDVVAGPGHVVAVSERGVHAFARTGLRHSWSHEIAGVAAVTLGRDRVAVTDSAGMVHLLDLRDGGLRWRSASIACGPPTVAGEVVLVGTRRGLLALRTADGSELWRSGARPACEPVASDGERALRSDLLRLVTAYDLESGRVAWRTRSDVDYATAPTVHGTHVFVGHVDGSVSVLDAESGEVVDRLEGDGAVPAGAPVVTDGAVYVLDVRGRLHAHPFTTPPPHVQE